MTSISEDEGSAILATSILASFQPLSSIKRLVNMFYGASASKSYNPIKTYENGFSKISGQGSSHGPSSSVLNENDCMFSSLLNSDDVNRSKCLLYREKNTDSTSPRVRQANPEVKLVKFNDVPAYLQFNQYVLNGYRPPNLTSRQCLRSLFYFHNETINIITHVVSMVIFGLYMPQTIPWDEIKHPMLAVTCLVGSVSSWIGSSIYHLFMNHRKGESFYINLLQWDVTGIWVTQAIGASTTVYTSVACYSPLVRWSYIGVYFLLSSGSLRDSLLARNAWSRILGFGSLFLMRIIAFLLRLFALGPGAGSPLIHVVMQELWALFGSLISATRVPERWFPGKFDFFFNSHNLMHVFVVLGAFHMVAAAKADLLWLNQDRCS